jgi:AraC-like DNA-binding protein
MIEASPGSCFRTLSADAVISARIIRTEHVHVEHTRCHAEATLEWNIPRPRLSLVWVRDNGSDARVTVDGRSADSVAPGRANFWFFPEGVGGHGELTCSRARDCAGVFVEPSFLPPAVKQALTEPIAGFAHNALGRAFNAMIGELAGPDDPVPLFTDGWAMQAFAYVARVAKPAPRRASSGSGLAPWQLRRAKEMLRADLAENLSLAAVAQACRLSVSHFARAFKVSAGVPPHQWLMASRIEAARDLLAKSRTPLVEVAGMCGFADQSHFSRVFGRIVGTSPGAWRRTMRNGDLAAVGD